MKKFLTKDIETFLVAIDKNISSPFEIIIIGGTAAALAYKVGKFTKDIDTVNSIRPIEAACEKARVQTGLDIPIGPAGVEQSPYNYEERLEELKIEGLKKLKIFVPEKHDLVLMKITRANANDIETIIQIHKNYQLDHKILIERYKSEMSAIIGNKIRLKTNFLATMERVFKADIFELIEKEMESF